jgi:hypothetical protein
MAHALFGRGQPMTPNDYRKQAPPWGDPYPEGAGNYQDEAPPFRGPSTPKGTNYQTEAPGLVHPESIQSPRGGMEHDTMEGWKIARYWNTKDGKYTHYDVEHENGRQARIVRDTKTDTYVDADRPSEPLGHDHALRKMIELFRLANEDKLSARGDDDVVQMVGDVELRASIYRQSARRLLGSHHKWLDTDPGRLDRRQLMRARAHAMLTGRGW